MKKVLLFLSLTLYAMSSLSAAELGEVNGDDSVTAPRSSTLFSLNATLYTPNAFVVPPLHTLLSKEEPALRENKKAEATASPAIDTLADIHDKRVAAMVPTTASTLPRKEDLGTVDASREEDRAAGVSLYSSGSPTISDMADVEKTIFLASGAFLDFQMYLDFLTRGGTTPKKRDLRTNIVTSEQEENNEK